MAPNRECDMRTFVIAEAGSNHNRIFKQALSLIDAAKEAGADAVKFQTYSSETLYSKNTPDFAGHTNIPKLIKDIEIPREWQRDLKLYCDENNIEFMSTPFDQKAVEELVDIGVKRLKISGFESTDFRFVDMVASTGLPLIISLGIGFKDEYLDKINQIADNHNNDLTLLHCNNAYPTPMNEINLGVIKNLIHNKRFKVGLSDHTTSIYTPSFAVMLGATVVEKHFTLSKKLPGPDHPFAVEPCQLKQMIEIIREAEKTLIPNKELYSNSELKFVKARRSVIAKVDIKKGDIFTTDNITTKRPYLEGCISASKYEYVVGSRSTREYAVDDFIKNDWVGLDE